LSGNQLVTEIKSGLYDQLFFLAYIGRFSVEEAYRMPVHVRTVFVAKLAEVKEREQDAQLGGADAQKL
jgi:hypothetical protein